MATAGYNSSVLVASLPSVAFTDEATTTSDLTTYTISNATKRYFDKSVAVVVQAQYDEVQLVTITGSPTGGTFTLTFGANTTSAIAYNAAASAVQSALQALASIGSGNMLVTGSAGGPYTCEFTAGKGLANQALMTASGAGLTGGSSPGVTVSTVQDGATWATITTGFTLYRANARVVFTSAQAPGAQVRFHSGNYFPYATVAEAASCEFSGKMGSEDTTTFNASGTHSFTPTTITGTLKYGSFWINNARAASLVARDFLIVSFSLPTGNRYEGFCYASDCNIKSDVNKVVTQDLVFQLTDEFFNA